ncbi:MAG: hypothetical protein ACFFD2_09070 [Promethearchaeota archaeon]
MQFTGDIKEIIKNRFGYNDEELKEFIDNPRNQQVLSKYFEVRDKTFVIEVVASHGCASEHRVGDKIYLDSSACLLTKYSPKRICIYALSEIDKLVYAINELIFAGVDPNEMRFNRLSCIDAGLKCGGWGQIVMEIRVEDRKKIE